MPAFWLSRFSWLLSAAAMCTAAVAGLVLFGACATAAMAADASQPSKSATTQAAPSTYAAKPMITRNPDGSFTIHNEPRNGTSKTAKAKGGLVIPPQVVTPIFSTPEKK